MRGAVDVVILTALDEERHVVLRHVREPIPSGPRGSHTAKVGDYEVVVAAIFGTGNPNAALATQQAIAAWDPSHVILAGILGALADPDTRMLGDVIVAEQVVAYEPAKTKPQGHERRYDVFRPAKPLLDAARILEPSSWALSIHAPRPDDSRGRVIPHVHFGVVGSGEKVVADDETIPTLHEDWATLIAVEMEGVGVALAAYASETLPGFLLVKGISDWADPSKTDDWHRYAAESSAAFVVALLETTPFPPRAEPRRIQRRESRVYSGKIKLTVTKRLMDDWKDLADYFEISRSIRDSFAPGDGPRRTWEWIEQRGKLDELQDALRYLGRGDLVEELETANAQHDRGREATSFR